MMVVIYAINKLCLDQNVSNVSLHGSHCTVFLGRFLEGNFVDLDKLNAFWGKIKWLGYTIIPYTIIP